MKQWDELTQAHPALEKVLLALGLLGATLAAVTPLVVVPQFDEVFKNFGAELPLFTHLVVHYYAVACVLPLLVLVVWHFWPRRKLRSLIACCVGLGSLALAVPVLVVAMYLPIFSLAATI